MLIDWKTKQELVYVMIVINEYHLIIMKLIVDHSLKLCPMGQNDMKQLGRGFILFAPGCLWSRLSPIKLSLVQQNGCPSWLLGFVGPVLNIFYSISRSG